MIPFVTAGGMKCILGIQRDVSWLINMVMDRQGHFMSKELFDNSSQFMTNLSKLSVVWQMESTEGVQQLGKVGKHAVAGNKSILDQYMHLLEFTGQSIDNPYRTLCDVFNDMQLGSSGNLSFSDISCSDMLKKAQAVIEDITEAQRCSSGAKDAMKAGLSDPATMASVFSEDRRRRALQFQEQMEKISGIKAAVAQNSEEIHSGKNSQKDREDPKRQWRLAAERVMDLKKHGGGDDGLCPPLVVRPSF